MPVVGTPTPLVDGRAKVTGALHFTADLHMPGTLHARFVTSSYAHARLHGIDTSQALAVPGVVAVLTARDLPDIPPTSRTHLLLARERVIFVGQPVALVLAENETAAQDGAELVLVEYDPLPAAVTLDEALASDAPLVWEQGIPGEEGLTGNRIVPHPVKRGDVQAGFAAADVIIERTVNTPAVHQSSIETHAMLVQPDPLNGGATVWSSTQAPFELRLEIAQILDVPESDVRVIGMPVGGGFGGKFPIYEPLIALAARRVGRPVRLILTRMEELLATHPAPALRVHARIGAKNDGTLTALETEILIDIGCLPAWLTPFGGWILASQYRIPNVLIQTSGVLTFKPSVGSYRAPLAPTMIFVIDCLLDELAARLNRDPLDVKRQNITMPGDRAGEGRVAPVSGVREVLNTLQQHPLWQNREQARAAGHGVGMAIAGWTVGLEPGVASCSLNRDGKIQINVGSVDLGGTATSFTLMAAEIFGVVPQDVRVVIGDTANAPFSGATAGSKITVTTGSAVVKAAAAARQQVLEIAAQEFEAAVDDLEIVNGNVQVKGVPSQAIKLGDLASKTMQYSSPYAPVVAQGRFAGTEGAPVYNGQLAEVEIDPETGEVRVLKLVVVQDVGRAINPLAIEGQLHGGAAQGIGWALYERLLHDDQGQLLTGSWMDYALPTSTAVPPAIETILIEVASESGPLGARGVGEPPVIPTAAAIANAIAHATGVRLANLPMSAPQVLAALNGG